jgi:hypothetical protein
MPLDVDNFNALYDRLRRIDLFGTAPPAPPWGTAAPDEQSVGTAIASGANLVPLRFVADYVDPLVGQLPRVLNALQGDGMLVETLAGAVYQHADPTVATDLHRFLAVISNLYRSFLSANARLAAGIPLAQQDPPLAMFQNDGDFGPFTLTVDSIQQLTGGSIGVVSLPATYRAHPLTWVSLAHETGGHDVLHADAGLLPELRQGIAAMFGGGPPNPSQPVSTSQLLGALWSYWIDESASDLYGVLNIGPTFGHNLGAFFAALGAQHPGSENAPARIRTSSGADERGALDPHPTDLLRLDLIIGAVQSLQGLAQPVRADYVAQLRELSLLLAPGATEVRLQGILPLDAHTGVRLNTALPLADMQAAARRVGAFIVTARLQALGGHAIQELETWDDADEHAATTIATAIGNGTPVVAAGDDAQLLAGGMLAVLAGSDYDATSTALGAALDASYASDPIWGTPQRDVLWLSGETILDASFLEIDTVEVVQIDGVLLP